VVLGRGLPNGGIILAGPPGGICDDVIVAAGDDAVRVTAGRSEPFMVAIASGPNGGIDSPAGGDDVLAAVVCPGVDGTIETTPDPADVLSVTSRLCDLCPGSVACIIPGNDGVLQTVADPSDVRVPFVSSGADGIAQSTAAGDDLQVIAPGSGFPDTVCVDAGADGLAQTTICGNGVADLEENGIANDLECDDGNTMSGDGCNALCVREYCGDGIVQAGEECDDGNPRNDDACVLNCRNARCGDNIVWRGVENCDPPNGSTCSASCRAIPPPRCGDGTTNVGEGEECDDGNHSNEDNCTTNCRRAQCGDGFVHERGTPPFEECDDGNTVPGDGCSPTCQRECGNGVIDGACSQGNVGAACSTNASCDTSPGAGDGVCLGETCDPGAAALCAPGPQSCSNVCRIAACGNGEVECDEDCDLGPLNDVPGSGCTPACKRNVVGAREPRRAGECPGAWTLDSAPRELRKTRQACSDGAACDFDVVPGQCTFRVGVCLNRALVPGCIRGGLLAFDLLKIEVQDAQQAAAAEQLTAAVRNLAPSVADVPGRCREGLRGKVCSIPDHRECDTHFGSGDGVCDIGTGVVFSSPLDPPDMAGDQVAICTPGVDVVVALGSTLKLRSIVRREGAFPDRDIDTLRLVCKP
jgi:cysteine-rich repeat protein